MSSTGQGPGRGAGQQRFRVRRADWRADGAALRRVRQAVFVEEQQVPPPEEWDGRDAAAVHLLAEDAAGRPLGCARLLDGGKIGRLAVLPAHRGRGVGRALLQAVIELAEAAGPVELQLDAQLQALDFYRPFGFEARGPVFDDAGIPHRLMVRPVGGGDHSPRS
jgi:predicted GNAT family N-acyltransferase